MDAHQKIIKDNARTLLKIITQQYNCKYSAALLQVLKSHPDFPSFLSLQYILHRMGKESFAMQSNYDELQNLSLPFVAHVTTNVDLFLFISKVTTDKVQIVNEDRCIEEISSNEFKRIWDGNLLLIDSAEGITKLSFKDHFNTFIEHIRFPFFIVSIISALVFILASKKDFNTQFYLYLSGIVGGLTASVLLFIEQIDKHNIHIKKLCTAKNSKSPIDCSSILDFKDAYFMGVISWSDVGFVYFAFLLAILLMFPVDQSLIITNILSILCIGYVCYSLFYQKFIAKKWCTLCLAVQGVFVFLFVLSIQTLSTNGFNGRLHIEDRMGIGLTGITILATYMVLKHLIIVQNKNSVLQRKFNELIFDENITQYLFSKEPQINNLDKAHKIIIPSQKANTHITLVFSPICASCIKDLQTLLPIIQRRRNIQLELIFLLDEKKHPESLVIAQYMLRHYKEMPDKFRGLLQEYVSNYPISKNKILQKGELHVNKDGNDVISLQEKWCFKHNIYGTPALFINGSKYPEYYNIKDIDYLFC